ncbi:hypothetical protein [Parachitinimonas caeni]|uniref:Uncharacterized protein n=1 Tax=Parachitinimonas caeni TaxID=3031301 RepID=A0ABT7DV50_9NEIS|nr:hypothetical protein [Parachitinimonas caeni]MDK2123937.1 hypothetical protein [Parachitinimonas caeni]
MPESFNESGPGPDSQPPCLLIPAAGGNLAGQLIGRLQRGGFPVSSDQAEWLQAPRRAVWLLPNLPDQLPPLPGCELIIDSRPLPPALAIALASDAAKLGMRYLDLAVQDSPFAALHGYAMAVGGSHAVASFARPWLDCLAPIRGGWWHCGEAGAASFVTSLLGQWQGSLAQALQISSAWLSNPASVMAGITALHGRHQVLLNTLATMAAQYLASTEGEVFSGEVYPSQLLAGLPSFDAPATDSPARRLARFLVWLGNQGMTRPA